MERTVGVEQARGQLGTLAEEVAQGGDPVLLTKRGRGIAVIVGRDEYARLKESATRGARGQLQARLEDIRARVSAAGLEPQAVDEAIRMTRDLG